MASVEEMLRKAEEHLRKAEERLEKADATLTNFEQDQEGGQWLTNLRKKTRTGMLDDDEKKEKAGLEEKEKELRDDVRNRTDDVMNRTKHVEELQLRLTSNAQTGNDFMTRALGTYSVYIE